MKVKVSMAMTQEIRKQTGYKATLENLTPEQYQTIVDFDIFRNEEDFKPKTGKLQAIRIEYPPELFAVPRFITSRDLKSIFRRSDGTYEGFFKQVARFCEV